jgi:two-component system sensor kinase FixL
MDHQPEENKEIAILRGAVENTNDAFVTIDENHKVLFFNKAAEKIFGYRRTEVIGNDLDVIMSPRCSRDHRSAVERYVRTRVPRRIGHEEVIFATRKTGQTFPASISFSVSDVGGKLYFTGIVRDLTETRALQEQVSRAERLAALGQFVAEITHEIKNPLMLIGGLAQQLVRATGDEKGLKKLSIITHEVARLEDLLKQLREFYRPRTLNIQAIEVNPLLQEVYALVRDDCERKNIKIYLKETKAPAFIEGDRDKLKQVFLNLIGNSIDAMEEGGSLSFGAKVAHNRVEFAVSDDGCGISQKDLEKVFSPFFTTKKKGTGLGLSISRGIIEEHRDSSFDLKSIEGKGTTFTITMPLSNTPLP